MPNFLSYLYPFIPALGLLVFSVCIFAATPSNNGFFRYQHQNQIPSYSADSTVKWVRPMQFESAYFELGGTIYIQESSGKIKYQTYWDKRLFQWETKGWKPGTYLIVFETRNFKSLLGTIQL